jgi:hypothetical protein
MDPETESGLLSIAGARGMSVEDFLRQLVIRERAARLTAVPEPAGSETGMVPEQGLRIYRTGNPLPLEVIDDCIQRAREERSSRILGDVR